MRLAVIPARGGSKRIPRKNIRPFVGKPIIAYAIENALNSGLFDKVVVSTDDDEIASVAKHYGAEVPFVRPTEIANDYAVIAQVLEHAVSWFETEGQTIEYLCCLYATAPLLRQKDLQAGMNKVLSRQADLCLSVTSFSFPIQRSLKMDSDQNLSPFYPECMPMRSQDLEPAFHDAAQFYCGSRDALLGRKENASLHGQVIDRRYVQDIDTPEDWAFAELLYKAHHLGGEE